MIFNLLESYCTTTTTSLTSNSSNNFVSNNASSSYQKLNYNPNASGGAPTDQASKSPNSHNNSYVKNLANRIQTTSPTNDTSSNPFKKTTTTPNSTKSPSVNSSLNSSVVSYENNTSQLHQQLNAVVNSASVMTSSSSQFNSDQVKNNQANRQVKSSVQTTESSKNVHTTSSVQEKIVEISSFQKRTSSFQKSDTQETMVLAKNIPTENADLLNAINNIENS